MEARQAFPLIIVLSLGSAMGISSSLFAVVNAAWFKPWPVPDAARLRVIAARVSTDEWRSWPRESRTFSGLAAERSGEFTRLGGQVLHTHLVSANYFQVLRVPMAMGRTLTPDDASDAAVISYELSQRRFRTDPDIVRTVDRARFGLQSTRDGTRHRHRLLPRSSMAPT
jgi:hypothetical protein